MILILLISCAIHKTSLAGIVDYVGPENCAVEINAGEVIVLESALCKKVKEGDTIYFYGRKK